LGRIVVKSDCVFQGYFGDAATTSSVMDRGWYLGLGDHGFALESSADGQLDYFWVGRDAGLMIRGGANTSCEQVASELKVILTEAYELKTGSFDLAVIGLKLGSEHEDSCCVLLELRDVPSSLEKRIESEFLKHARKVASKGARPDRLLIGALPRNFKGALDVRALRREFAGP
jgi:acyl-CoA synthetase (AMP-forming)/AMP-acid ligase II